MPKPNKPQPPRILSHIFGQPWIITHEGLETVIQVAEREGDIEAVLAKRGEPLENTSRVEVRDGVAILPVRGPIVRYANIFSEISGATSIERLAKDFNAALEDPEVKSIVLDIDSPGGQVTGVNEFAEMIFAARETKPVIAYVGGLGASAAYWIASAASKVVADPTSGLGSIGVVIGYRKQDDNTIEIGPREGGQA